MSKKKIVLVDYGIASIYGDGTIELNRKIRGRLKAKILQHERRHTIGKYSLKDFRNDFMAKSPHFLESFKFALKNPEALVNYGIFMYSYNRRIMTWNSSGLYPFVYFGAIFMTFWFMTLRISPLISLIAWSFIYAGINGALLFITHRYICKISHSKIRKRTLNKCQIL